MSTESQAAIAALVGIAVIFLIALYLWVQSRRETPSADKDHDRIYGLRWIYFSILTIAMAATLGVTLHPGSVPYFNPHPDFATPLVVKVTGSQWVWAFQMVKGPNRGAKSFNSLKLPYSEPAEFQVTASDVNHSFAIYDVAGTLLTQTQAMPGYVNKLYFRFPKPGIYHVLCLEYCGVGHSVMHAEIEVTQTASGVSGSAQAAPTNAVSESIETHNSGGSINE